MQEVKMDGIVLRRTDNPEIFELEFEYQGEHHRRGFLRDEINGALDIIIDHVRLWPEEGKKKAGFVGHTYILGMPTADVVVKTGHPLANYLFNFPPIRVFFYHNAERISALIGR